MSFIKFGEWRHCGIRLRILGRIQGQILVRIAEDMRKKTRKESDPQRTLRSEAAGPEEKHTPEWRSLHCGECWEGIECMGNFLNSIIDLNESTKYHVRSKEENSEEWLPERRLLNIPLPVQQLSPSGPMRIAEKEGREICGPQIWPYGD